MALLAVALVCVPIVSHAQNAPLPVPTPTPSPTLTPPRGLPVPLPFRPPMTFTPSSGGAPFVTFQGVGFVSRPADRAAATIAVSATGATPEDIVGAVSATAETLQKTLERIHGTRVSAPSVGINGFSNGSIEQLNGNAQLDVSIDDLASLPAIRGAVSSTPGASLNNLHYDLRDRESANAAAIAAAIADVRAQAAALAQKTNVRLGRERSFQAYVQQRPGNDDQPLARVDATATVSFEVAPP